MSERVFIGFDANKVAHYLGQDLVDFSLLTPGVETYGSMITTKSAWVPFTASGGCGIKLLLDNLSPTGNFASLRVRARSSVATPTWNQNTIAADFAASANIIDYGELLGLASYAQDNGFAQNRGDHWSTAIKATMQCTAASAGSRWALVVSDYCTTVAATKHSLARFDKPTGAVTLDGVFDFGNCDRFTYFAHFEVSGGFLTNNDTRLQVLTPAGAKYITLT